MNNFILFQGFSHPALVAHQTIWSLENIPKVSEFTYAIASSNDRELVNDVIQTFSAEVLQKRHNFRKGITSFT